MECPEYMSIGCVIAGILFAICWDIGNCFVYLLFMESLKNAVMDTILAFFTKCYTVLRVFIILYLFCALTYIPYAYCMNINQTYALYTLSQLFSLIDTFGTMSLDFIISISMLFHCIRKLRNGIEKVYFPDNDNPNSNNALPKNDGTIFSPNNYNGSIQFTSQAISVTLLSIENHSLYMSEMITFTKISILSIIMTISTQIVLILQIIHTLIYDERNPKPYRVLNLIWTYYIMIDMILKSCFISLFFVFGDQFYQKLCGCLDLKIRICCLKRIEKKIMKQQKITIINGYLPSL